MKEEIKITAEATDLGYKIIMFCADAFNEIGLIPKKEKLGKDIIELLQFALNAAEKRGMVKAAEMVKRSVKTDQGTGSPYWQTDSEILESILTASTKIGM